MKSSKPIERLFQEGLKDFQASPSPEVWNGIEERLAQKKQKRRLVPLWWQVASVAAILAIFSTIGVFYHEGLQDKSKVTFNKEADFEPKSNSLEVIPAQYRFSSVSNDLSTFESMIDNALTFEISPPIESKTLLNSAEKKTATQSTPTDRSVLAINQVNRSSVNFFTKASLSSRLLGADDDKDSMESKKKSIFDAIEEDKLLADSELADESISKPWELKPNVAPVFMNSINGGNALESSLQGKTSSNPNVSFGVNVAYAINKKMKIRTGINQVAMGYSTQEVVLSTQSSSFRAEGSVRNNNIKTDVLGNVSVLSAQDRNNASADGSINTLFNESVGFSPTGALSHELGFVEVPLEIEYALIDRKVGLHLLGGASTYLLNNNEVFFEENGQSSNIGTADNLNSLSFSANFGVGIDYNFSEIISFNLEPKFLYQINTFQSNTTDFQPYFFGIYSGIKFKF